MPGSLVGGSTMPSGDPHDRSDSVSSDDLRRALRWSQASIVWTAGASTAAIIAGFAGGSLLLVAFGAVGSLDGVGSVVLALHFRHALHHEAISEKREREALLVIASGMAAIALATTIDSVHRVTQHGSDTHVSGFGITVAGTSIVALAVLGAGKQRVGRQIASRALIADSHVSLMGAALAAFTAAGAFAATALDWWWVDPIGSLVVAFTAFAVAMGHVRSG